MIPKIIHYCWFGGKPLPEDAKKYIESWNKYCPDYEIKEWNESNFDLDLYPFTREAYDARKFAFVTDVVRLYALYNYGGIYMDTDVEVIKPLDRFLTHTAFSGYEDDHNVPTGIMASEKGSRWAKDNLDYYSDRHFDINGNLDIMTNVEIITSYMKTKGLRCNNEYQDFEGLITIYPKDYFCPKSHDEGKIHLTDNTVTIHHFAGSWLSDIEAEALKASRKLMWIPKSMRIYVSKFIAFMKVKGLSAALKQTWDRITRTEESE